VDGRPVGLSDKGDRVALGATIDVAGWTPPEERTPIPEPDAPLVELERGPGWVAIDKPAGQPVHPLRAEETGTVLNALVGRWPYLPGIGEGGLRSGVVHRLDVDTSGVLLFATDEERFDALRTAFRRHKVKKTYRALVSGALRGEAELVLELAVAQHRPARVRVVPEGDPAHGRRTRRTKLAYRVLETFREASLVEVQPTTGFLHQIRVSLAHLGHPILGDRVYGDERVAAAAPRHMLHAAAASVRDVAATSPDPPDFAAVLERERER
nr:RNA pseudouridine synthase [Myxococcota bacterium]